MALSLRSLIPNADDLLALEPEKIAGILLMHLNSYGDNSGDGSVHLGRVNQYNFFNNLHHHPEYPNRQLRSIEH
jgi:hypothetical protein